MKKLHQRRLHIEVLDERALPAVFNVGSSDVAALTTAFTTANTNGESDTINLTASTYTFTAVNNDTDGGNALPVLGSDVGSTITLNGNGATFALTGVSADMRFLSVNGATLEVRNLTFTGGKPQFGDGGAILVRNGSLDVRGCLFQNNTSEFDGGAIAFLEGTDGGFIGNCTFTQNTARAFNESELMQGGGAIYVNTPGSPTITIRNCTIVNNTVEGFGEGNFDYGGGGVLLAGGGAIQIENSIVADNTADGANDDVNQGSVPLQVGVDFDGSISARNSLIRASLAAVNGGQISMIPVGTAPGLGVLANNGGLSQTFALLPGSPCINAGDNGFLPDTRDQRGPGFARISGGTIDIGAFELPQLSVTLNLTQSAARTRLKQAVTFTMRVLRTNNEGPTPTGTVSFFDRGVLLGTVTLDAQGIARLTTSKLKIGTHPIQAVYSGDATYSTGSRTVQHVVAGSVVGRRWAR